MVNSEELDGELGDTERPVDEIGFNLGRPNIGKSTLVNRMLGEDRHVVCIWNHYGLNRFCSDCRGAKYRFVDTAGIRRRAKIDERLEAIAVGHAIRTIERCHLCILMIDGVEG